MLGDNGLIHIMGIIGAFILYMALVITEAICKSKKFSMKKAFFMGSLVCF